MRIYKYFLLLALIFLFSCGNKNGNLSKFLNQSAITKQLFAVDINNDTILVTQNGCIIKLPKGTLESKVSQVKLEIKEALSNTDMVLAGLTTMSGGRALSSGGMIYINAAEGYQVTIKKEIEILVPSKTYNPAMQVFTGNEASDGSIDWQKPTPLPDDETTLKINNGEILFKANCAACHKIDKDFTGPALAGITDRRPKSWLYAFTRNSAKLIHDGYYSTAPEGETVADSSHGSIVPDFYRACMHHKWNNSMMTAFPQLSDADLDAIYAYIKTESDKVFTDSTGTLNNCCDSCGIFGKALYAASRENINPENKAETELFNLDRTIQLPANDANTTPIAGITNTQANSTEIPETVRPNQIKATYYTINIKAFGWYNIDIMMEDFSKCIPSELFVRLQGSYEIDVNIVLVIPSVKAFVEGGKLKDGKQYGFDETDGKIPLPQNARCYVMAFGEYNSKIIFGKTDFLSNQSQTIEVVLSETSKEGMSAQIKALNLDDVNLDIKRTDPAGKTEDKMPTKEKKANFDKMMEDVLKLKPANCDCGFRSL